MEAFQLMKEYNTTLFSWYFKGFKLLRRYLDKHLVEMDLENLDLQEVDKEMTANEASQSTAPEGDATGDIPLPPTGNDTIANAWTYLASCLPPPPPLFLCDLLFWVLGVF